MCEANLFQPKVNDSAMRKRTRQLMDHNLYCPTVMRRLRTILADYCSLWRCIDTVYLALLAH